jgi:mono/diheme cytochrome c family protein
MLLLKRIALALGAFVVLAVLIVYGASQLMIRTTHDAELEQIAIPKDAASIAEGGRLAFVFGCRGCHNASAQGSVWKDPPWFIATVAPPGIARKIADYSDAEVLRLIRHGIKKDGTSLMVMPTVSHRFISDDDAAKVIAWLRTLQPTDKDVTQPMRYGPLGRFGLLTGQFQPSYQGGKVAEAHRPTNLGRYYYDTVCSECHNINSTKLAPDGGATTPALAEMAGAYSPEAFRKLMRTGVGMSGRDLGLMKQVATENLFKLTDEEIVALQTWLKSDEAAKAK